MNICFGAIFFTYKSHCLEYEFREHFVSLVYIFFTYKSHCLEYELREHFVSLVPAHLMLLSFIQTLKSLLQ